MRNLIKIRYTDDLTQYGDITEEERYLIDEKIEAFLEGMGFTLDIDWLPAGTWGNNRITWGDYPVDEPNDPEDDHDLEDYVQLAYDRALCSM